MENNWRNRWKLAFKETRKALGFGSMGQIVLRALVIIGIISALLFFGSEDASRDEVVGRTAIAVMTAMLFPLFLVWNLIAAPYRLEKIENKRLKATSRRQATKLSELKAQLEKAERRAPDLKVEISQLAWNGKGTAIRDDDVEVDATSIFGPGVFFMVMLTITNRGELASAVPYYRMNVTVDGVDYALKLTRVTSSISLNFGGRTLTMPKDQWIIASAHEPIPSGGIRSGFIIGTLVEFEDLHPSHSASLAVSVEDVKGRVTQDQTELVGQGTFSYFPGAVYS